jgi:hypothetical protein
MPSTPISSPVGEQHRAVHGVLQLAHVAGPAVEHQPRLASATAAHRHAVGGGVFLDEVLGELEHVGRPLAQRRDFQVHDVEAEQQVLAERALAHGLGQVAVRGRDDADVDRHRLGAADAVDHALLDGAQQLGLQPHVHLGDFVEQQRAAGRPPRTCRCGARPRR